MDMQTRIAEIEEFIRYSAVEWPRLRADLLDQIAPRCSKCIVSERYVPLVHGVCEYCLGMRTESEPVEASVDTTQLEGQLADVLHKAIGKSGSVFRDSPPAPSLFCCSAQNFVRNDDCEPFFSTVFNSTYCRYWAGKRILATRV